MEDVIDIIVDYENYDFIVDDAREKSRQAIISGLESAAGYDHTKITYRPDGKIIIESFSFFCPIVKTTVDGLVESIIQNVERKGIKLKL